MQLFLDLKIQEPILRLWWLIVQHSCCDVRTEVPPHTLGMLTKHLSEVFVARGRDPVAGRRFNTWQFEENKPYPYNAVAAGIATAFFIPLIHFAISLHYFLPRLHVGGKNALCFFLGTRGNYDKHQTITQ